MPVHALSVAHFVCMWGIYTNLSCLPQYYIQILAFDVDNVSLYYLLIYFYYFVHLFVHSFVRLFPHSVDNWNFRTRELSLPIA